jgi:hypothetical protein
MIHLSLLLLLILIYNHVNLLQEVKENEELQNIFQEYRF